MEFFKYIQKHLDSSDAVIVISKKKDRLQVLFQFNPHSKEATSENIPPFIVTETADVLDDNLEDIMAQSMNVYANLVTNLDNAQRIMKGISEKAVQNAKTSGKSSSKGPKTAQESKSSGSGGTADIFSDSDGEGEPEDEEREIQTNANKRPDNHVEAPRPAVAQTPKVDESAGDLFAKTPAAEINPSGGTTDTPAAGDSDVNNDW